MFKEFILFLFIIFVFFTKVFTQTSKQEIDSLKDLYQFTKGENWKKSKNWLKGDPCSGNWYGITCIENENEDFHVFEVYLSHNNLNGFISDSIGNLTYVESLYFDRNEIISKFPKTIAKLSKLKLISFAENQFYGELPEEIGELKLLGALHLGENNFTKIPDSISKLEKLNDFVMNSNNINTKCPADGPPPIIHHVFPSQCDLSKNDFICPLPDWAKKDCHATCKP